MDDQELAALARSELARMRRIQERQAPKVSHHLPQPSQPGFCPDVCCGRYMAHRDDLASYLPADLDNAPAPIFAKEQFPDDIDYCVVEISCRMATIFCRTPGAAKYVSTMAFGENRIFRPDGIPGKHVDWRTLTEDDEIVCLPLPSHETNMNRNREQSDIVLGNLTGMTKFLVGPLDEGVNGTTTALEEDPQTVIASMTEAQKVLFFNRGRIGTRTEIRLSEASYTHLEYLHYNTDTTPVEDLLNAQMHLALILTHEIAHALEKALRGWRSREAFYNTNALAEAGYDLQSAIFGGILNNEVLFADNWRHKYHTHCEASHARGEMMSQKNTLFHHIHWTLREWPCGNMSAFYERTQTHIPAALGVALPDFGRSFRVPFRYINALLTKGEWLRGSVVGVPSTCTLQVPVVGSIWFGSDEDGDLEAKGRADLDWENYACWSSLG